MTERVLIYDRDCGLCRTIVACALGLDRRRRLRPLALQSGEAERLLPGMTDEQRMGSFHIVAPGGRVSSAGRGLAELAVLLPGLGPLGRALHARPVFSERAYRLVADHRDAIGPWIPDRIKDAATRTIDSRSAD